MLELYAEGTFSGNYLPQGDPQDAGYIAMHEFGLGRHGTPGRVNERLATFTLGVLQGWPELPLVAGKLLTEEVKRQAQGRNIEINFAGQMETEGSPLIGVGGGTWGELLEEQRIASEYGLHDPVRVAQANQAPRAAQQARKLGLTSILLPGLPKGFDKHSRQVQTRGSMEWALYSLACEPFLRVIGRL